VSDNPQSCDIPVWPAGYRERCGQRLTDGECPRHGLRCGGGAARDLIQDYWRRKGQPGRGTRDGFYQYEVAQLTDLLCRLEVILDDEGVDGDTRRRVIRAMLYASPSEAEAEYRMTQEREMTELLKELPLSMHVTGIDPSALAKLGLPPR
jgi:hypothetical protein